MEHVGSGRDMGDPYAVLGVSTDASQRDIARAYRRAVRHAHPDAQPHDPQAAARFRALTDAYELLGHPDRRADYDWGRLAAEAGRTGTSTWRPGSPFPGPSPSQLIWAGPVHVEPPATATSSRGRSAPAEEFDDPIVILGVRHGQVRGVW